MQWDDASRPPSSHTTARAGRSRAVAHTLAASSTDLGMPPGQFLQCLPLLACVGSSSTLTRLCRGGRPSGALLMLCIHRVSPCAA